MGLSSAAINILADRNAEVGDWARKRSSELQVLIGSDLPQLKEKYGITGAPETFVLDGEARILAWHVGYEPGDEKRIEAEVRLALGQPPFP